MERRRSLPGGIDRAGVMSAGRGGATCLIGIGDGSGNRRFGTARPPWVLRAGLAARARVTGALPLASFVRVTLVCLTRVTGDRPLGCFADTRLRLDCLEFLAGECRGEGRRARETFFFLDFPAFKSFP